MQIKEWVLGENIGLKCKASGHSKSLRFAGTCSSLPNKAPNAENEPRSGANSA